MKRCSHCREEKSLTEFHRCKSRRDGLSFRCKPCDREAKRISRSKHKPERARWQCEHRRIPRVREGDRVWRKRYYQKHRDKALRSSRQWRAKNPTTYAWCKYQCSARSRGLEFNLPRALFDDLVTDRCYYCGAAPAPVNGIDRVDNERGYVHDNIVTCCRTCNYAKHDRAQGEFLSWVARIAEHLRVVRAA
jgi:hypothetical protein